MPDDGAKRRKLAFESDADMPDAPSPQFEAWAKWRDGPSRQMVTFLETDECGAAAMGMHTELMGRGLSQAGVDRATDWAAPQKLQHECLLWMALYERSTGVGLDVEKAEWQAPPPKSAPPARTENTAPPAGQVSAQGAPDPVSKEIEELESRLSQLRAPRIP